MIRQIPLFVSLTTAAAVLSLSGCSMSGPGGGAAQTVVATPTPEPIPTLPPDTPTPTVSPNLQGTLYTSPDKDFTIDLPDTGWRIRAEDNDRKSFESEQAGIIEVLHAKGADAMAAVLLPDTEDLAVSMEKAADLSEETDFDVLNYVDLESVDPPVHLYSYTVYYSDPAKTDGIIYTLHRYFVSDDEYYGLVASICKEDEREAVRNSLDTFTVLTGSPIAQLANGQSPLGVLAEGAAPDAQQPGEGENVPAQADGAGAAYTEDDLSDPDRTRTIYRNSDGEPIVIWYDEAAGWKDESGMTYRFSGEQDVYDENDVDYYWHWEAGDVAFMPVVYEE